MNFFIILYLGETLCTLKSFMREAESQQNGNQPNPMVLQDLKGDKNVADKIIRRQSSDGATQNRGTIFVRTCTITHTPSFLDYIQSGAQVYFSLDLRQFCSSN
jgi:hypothetical protein